MKTLLVALRTFIWAPHYTKRGEVSRLVLCSVLGVLIGVGMALLMQAHYEEVDKQEAQYQQLIQSAASPHGGEKRWLAFEQLKLILRRIDR